MSNSKQVVAKMLCQLLADSYTLYLKTQNYHWNVKGSHFRSLHLLFDEQYKELAEAIDLIAERIRALGYSAPGSYRAFTKLATIKEAPENPPPALNMIAELAADHEAMAKKVSKIYQEAENIGDEVTSDLAVKRGSAHEKNVWMLRSNLEENADENVKVA